MAHLTNEPQDVTEVKRMLFHSGIQYDEDVVDTILTLQNQLLTEVVTEAKAVCHHQGKRVIQPEHITFACGVSKRRARRKFSRLPAANLKKLAEHIDAKGWPEPSKKPTALRLPSLQNCLAQPTYVIKHDLHDEDVRKKLADPTRGEKRNTESVPKAVDDYKHSKSSDFTQAISEASTYANSSTALPPNPTLSHVNRLPVNMQTAAASNAPAYHNSNIMPYTAFSTSVQPHAPSLITYATPQHSITSAVVDGHRLNFSRMPLMSSQQQQAHSMPGASMSGPNFALSTSSAGGWVNAMQQAGAIPVNRQPLPMAPQHMPGMQMQYIQTQGGNLHGFPPQPQNQYYLVPGPVQGQFIVQSGPMLLGNDGPMMMSAVGQPSSMASNTFRAATSLPVGFTRQNSRDYLPINVNSNHLMGANNTQVPVSVVAASAVSAASNPTQDVNLDNIF